MAMIHEQLYQSESLARINMKDYLSSLALFIVDSFSREKQNIAVDVTIPGISFDIDTVIPVGLIVNELVSNSMKYAFVEGGECTLRLALEAKDARFYQLTVEDNGVGLPSNMEMGAADKLGLQMVYALSEQLGGSFTINNGPEQQGAKALVTFLLEKP